jgi:hypothetical protein
MFFLLAKDVLVEAAKSFPLARKNYAHELQIGEKYLFTSCVITKPFKRFALEVVICEHNEVTFEVTGASSDFATCQAYEEA